MTQADAGLSADVLVYADLHGIDSHGVQFQMKGVYVPGLTNGSINPRPEPKTVVNELTTAVIDGDRGLGHPTSVRAMRLAIDKARDVGVGIVAVRNSTHFGAAGYYARLAADADMVGLAMTNAPPRVLPTFGREPMLGTNPIAVAAPSTGRPILVDLATSTTSAGKLFVAERTGARIPATWATDENGVPTTDARTAVAHSKLLPLGGSYQTGGYKGYALAVAVDIFAGLLSGAGHSASLQRPVVGHFFGAFNIDTFRSLQLFKEMADEMASALRATPTIDSASQVLVPGDPEHAAFEDRSINGIPLPRSVYEYLLSTAGGAP